MGDLKRDVVTVTRFLDVRGAIGRDVAHPGDGNNYVTSGESAVFADTSSSTATISIGDSDANTPGYTVHIVDAGGNAGTNNITVSAETDADHNVDGSNQDLTISTNFSHETIMADENGDLWSVS